MAATLSMMAAPTLAEYSGSNPAGASAGTDFKAYDTSNDIAHGWRGGHHRHRDDGIDAGDIFAGILVLGGIAAIASAVSKDREEPRRYPADGGYRDRDASRGSGLGRAADMCVAEVERRRGRVASVDNAARDASGWTVSGEIESGEAFVCRIGDDGRIEGVEISPGYSPLARPSAQDGQYDDAVYARIRADQAYASSGLEQPAEAGASEEDGDGAEPRPAYPGGPLPGEAGYDEYMANGA